MAKKLVHDKILFTTLFVLVVVGLTMVYSAGAAVAGAGHQGLNSFLVKQTFAAGVGALSMFMVMHLDYRVLRKPGVIYGLLCGVIGLLVFVLFGPELNNTHRWFFVGGISVQPAELAKLGLIPFVAYHIERQQGRARQRELLIPCGLAFGTIAALILLQPDLGTSVLLGATVIILLFLAGLRWKYIVGAAVAALPIMYLLIGMVPYRRARFLSFLDPTHDPLGSGYQAHQSLIAVGSGGVWGLGLGESLQKLHFLPHPHSDFVYSILAEELGLVGALAILLLFGVLLWRGCRAGLRAPDLFGRYLAWGFTGLLVIQALIHISVALALMPTKGIPLPFISYGGSSLVVSMTAGGVILNLSQHG
jgi:cell division protein FtsW